jgi:hypothetical protein
MADLQKAGHSEPDARQRASELARTHFWNRFRRDHADIGQA